MHETVFIRKPKRFDSFDKNIKMISKLQVLIPTKKLHNMKGEESLSEEVDDDQVEDQVAEYKICKCSFWCQIL